MFLYCSPRCLSRIPGKDQQLLNIDTLWRLRFTCHYTRKQTGSIWKLATLWSFCKSQSQCTYFMNYLRLWQVASNGIISFGSAFTNFDATLFPNPNNQGIFNSFIVAPYWSDIDARVFGEIWYETHVVGQSTVSNSLLDRVSSLVRSEQNHPTFQGTWMLVATWNDTVQFGASSEQVTPIIE